MGVWGVSGGGAYALACAALLPELVTGAAVFASFAPYGSPGLDFCEGMSPEYASEVGLLFTDRATARQHWCQDPTSGTPRGLRQSGRCDLQARTVRIRAAYVERSTGPLVLGPPKSKAGRRVVGIRAAIIPDLRRHLKVYVKDDPGALVFPGVMGGPIRRGNFNRLARWPHAVAAIGMPGLHFHDLRHTGNQFAADSGAGLRDLMARMGHDSERAAMIYQHEARGADRAITDAIDAHVDNEKHKDDGDDAAGALVPAS